jgi:hypothetical protein
MKQQEDDEGRREMSQALLGILAGVNTVDDLQRQLHPAGLHLRQVELPSGGCRFIVIERKNGKVWDSFTFYGEDSMTCLEGKFP